MPTAISVVAKNKSRSVTSVMGKKPLKLSEQIRHAIDTSGHSRYAICKATGILESTMSRFMNKQCGLSQESFDAIAEFLRLEITRRGK
jgi:predicted XRE-type DNA-binding protein